MENEILKLYINDSGKDDYILCSNCKEKHQYKDRKINKINENRYLFTCPKCDHTAYVIV